MNNKVTLDNTEKQSMNNWDLLKLQRQATNNQDFDGFVLSSSRILERQNIKVLDVGCSNGFKTKMLFDGYDNIEHITGIDIDKKAILEAQNKFKDNDRYSFELKSIYDIKDEQYDLINLSYVLQHLENPQEALKLLRSKLTDRGILILKVPDDSFKHCYPDDGDLLHKIFDLYENKIMRNQEITKFTDRYIGKKVSVWLKQNGYKDVKVFYSISDTLNKTLEERLELFNRTIAFRNGEDKQNITEDVKNQMKELLNKFKKKFEDDDFYYSMTILYYIATK